MPVGRRTNPHIVPCWRDYQGLDSLQRLVITQRLTIHVQIAKAVLRTYSPNTWPLMVDITKTSNHRRLERIDRKRNRFLHLCRYICNPSAAPNTLVTD